MQLRFTSLVVINSRWDLHPQECAHAGRTKVTAAAQAAAVWCRVPTPILRFSLQQAIVPRERGEQ